MAIVAVLCLRLFFVSLLVIPQDGEKPVFHAGDRVLVSRLAYGLRLPFEPWTGSVCLWPRSASRGEWAAFNNPADTDEPVIGRRRVFVGYCFGMPADTIWLNACGQAACRRNRRKGFVWPLVVPSRGARVRIEPWNAPIYARTINAHEPFKAAVIDNRLCVDGRMVNTYTFRNDYYWMTSGNALNRNDSRMFGFVPSGHLIGRLRRVLYSLDASRPWYNCLRSDRLGLEVASGSRCSNSAKK